MKTGWKIFIASVISFVTGFLLTFLNKKTVKGQAEAVIMHEVRQRQMFSENKEVKEAIKSKKKQIEKQNRKDLKKSILDTFM